MRIPLTLAFAINVCTAGLAVAQDAPSRSSALEQCGAYSQVEMRTCLMDKAKQSEAALRRAQLSVSTAIAKWDEDERYIAQAKDQLKLATRKFAEYRNVQCAFHTSLGGGAIMSGLEQRRLACVTDLNNKQAQLYMDETSNLPARH